MESRGIWGMLVVMVALSFMVVGCGSTPKEPIAASVPTIPADSKLDGLLRKYMLPSEQNWNDANGGITYVYYLDPFHFKEFRSKLDTTGEYSQVNEGYYTRDWEQGKLFARWVVRPDGSFKLNLCNKDNSTFEYNYKKKSSASSKTDALIRQYLVPTEEYWDINGVRDDKAAYVYYLDPLRFEEFKSEVDRGDEYYPTEIWTEKNRNWEQGRTFARWVVLPDGRLELGLYKDDNSEVRYWYRKYPPAGDQKTIKITGFDGELPVWTNKFGITGKSLWINWREADTAERNADGTWLMNPGDTEFTFELTFSMLSKDDKSSTERPWTGSGAYYIQIGGLGGIYYYSVNGTDPALVDINSTVTTLNWSDFVLKRED